MTEPWKRGKKESCRSPGMSMVRVGFAWFYFEILYHPERVSPSQFEENVHSYLPLQLISRGQNLSVMGGFILLLI